MTPSIAQIFYAPRNLLILCILSVDHYNAIDAVNVMSDEQGFRNSV
jgi:hypothetical protein